MYRIPIHKVRLVRDGSHPGKRKKLGAPDTAVRILHGPVIAGTSLTCLNAPSTLRAFLPRQGQSPADLAGEPFTGLARRRSTFFSTPSIKPCSATAPASTAWSLLAPC